MSAEELRQAAETLRERASAVPCEAVETSGAWDSGVGLRRTDGSWFHLAPTTYERRQRADFQAASAYIATMHPGVGLALADALEWSASHDAGTTPGLVEVARLINGGAS